LDGAPARQVLLSLLLNSPVPLVCCSIGTSVGILARRLGRLGSSSARRLGSSRRLCSRVVDGIDGSSRRRFGSAQLVGLAQLIVGGARRVGSVLVSLMAQLVSSAQLVFYFCRLARRVSSVLVSLTARLVSSAQLVCSARLFVFCFRRLGPSRRLSALARWLQFGSVGSSARFCGSSARRHVG